MDNRINEIRKQIRALRIRTLEAEAIMHDQINRDLGVTVTVHKIDKRLSARRQQ
jgi:hypothetical protein